MKASVCVAGNIVVDRLYPINGYPARGELTQICDGISLSTGGAVCNTGMDIAALLPGAAVSAAGMVGRDADGDFAVQRMTEGGVDCSRVRRASLPTAFTAVMNDLGSGERTFFTYAGANREFDRSAVDLDGLSADLFHIGYILLLDALDAPDAEYGTQMAHLLADIRARGIKTSVDVVSESGDRFARLVPPALRYTDYCVINELEASATTGIPLRAPDGALLVSALPRALEKLHEMGVAEWAVIHAPEGGYGMDRRGEYVSANSLALPADFIQGKVGAGDAFCAGVLASAAQNASLADAVRLGIATAAMSLSRPDATSGVGCADDGLALYAKYAK